MNNSWVGFLLQARFPDRASDHVTADSVQPLLSVSITGPNCRAIFLLFIAVIGELALC